MNLASLLVFIFSEVRWGLYTYTYSLRGIEVSAAPHISQIIHDDMESQI